MSAATAHESNPYLRTDAAGSLLVELRRATDGRTGDRLSTAIRAVTTAGSTLPPDQVEAAIAAIALLLTEYEPSLLDGAADEVALRAWLHDVDTELTPGRRLAATAALARIELVWTTSGTPRSRRQGRCRRLARCADSRRIG